MDSKNFPDKTVDVKSLKSRWMKMDSEKNATILENMILTLKTKCRLNYSPRPFNLDLRGIPLIGQDLSKLDFSGFDLSYANLNTSDLTGSNFSNTNLQYATLEKTILDECEFMGADLSFANLNECTAKRSGFGGANFTNASLISSDLRETTLSHSILIHSDFRASNIRDSRLSEADLTDAIFTRARLSGSDLKNSNVKRANFELSDLQGCRLLGIKNFTKALWIGADIRGMDLRGAYLVRRYIADENYLYEFKTRNRFYRMLHFIWWMTSDCGRSLLRWFVWLFFATMAFAAVYTQVNIDFGDHQTFFSPVYFSFVTLTTLGYGDAVPASFAAQVFVTLQAITGYMGLGGLLSILGNKMARRAE